MCDCIEDINKQLVELKKNTQLDIPIIWNISGKIEARKRVMISVKKIDGKKREAPINITPPFCPFCGEPYGD